MNHRKIIEKWPSCAALADDIGAEHGTVRQWKNREQINSRWWIRLITKAKERGIDLDFTMLAKGLDEAIERKRK